MALEIIKRVENYFMFSLYIHKGSSQHSYLHEREEKGVNDKVICKRMVTADNAESFKT